MMGVSDNLRPIKPGEVRNIYGAAGNPETREERAKKKMEKKIIKEAVMKELYSMVPGTDLTVLEHLVKRTIQNAASGNDRLFNKLVDMIDGPITQHIDNNITSNQPNVMLYIPALDTEEENNKEEE